MTIFFESHTCGIFWSKWISYTSTNINQPLFQQENAILAKKQNKTKFKRCL